VVVIEIKDAELITALEARAAEVGVTDGAIVSLIGAADSFTVSTMPAGDASEMSGTGELVAGKAHVHATFGVHGDRAVTGHLHRAQVTTHFARVYLIPISTA
jgi:predicted DNA-binding protein with PD1-like motif